MDRTTNARGRHDECRTGGRFFCNSARCPVHHGGAVARRWLDNVGLPVPVWSAALRLAWALLTVRLCRHRLDAALFVCFLKRLAERLRTAGLSCTWYQCVEYDPSHRLYHLHL